MERGWKETIRVACSRATGDNQGPRIARDTGIAVARVHNFTSKGYLKTDDVKTIESWLQEHGYIGEEPLPAVTGGRAFTPVYAGTVDRNLQCADCGEIVPGFDQGATCCMVCGAPLGPVCPRCGAINLPGRRFCQVCTAPLDEAAAAEASRDQEAINQVAESETARRRRETHEKYMARRAKEKAARKRDEPEM